MKIGIITFLKVNNYGAELQAFALYKFIEGMNHNVEIIDYLHYKHPDFKVTRKAQPFIKLSQTQKIKEFLYPIISKVKSLPYRKQKRIRDQKFEHFHKNFTRLSSHTYRTIDELYDAKFDYDLFMVGSDQVWNPNTNVSLKPYFLDFAPEDKPKVSYASSFGVSELPEISQSYYRDMLRGFEHIAVRESQGLEIVDTLIQKKATHVVDPTLLLTKEDWREFSNQPNIDGNYILLYVLSDTDYISQLALFIAEQKNLKIIRLCKNASVEDKDERFINIIDAGPSEYLGLFQNASFVLTTSFHGTAFSVNFNIPFYTIFKSHKTNNSRQQSFLSSLGLANRLIPDNGKIPAVDQLNVDFEGANQKLAQQRRQSVAYLDKILITNN